MTSGHRQGWLVNLDRKLDQAIGKNPAETLETVHFIGRPVEPAEVL